MFIPAGYGNIQFMFAGLTSSQKALTAIGVHLVAADPEEVLDDAATVFGAEFSPVVSDYWTGETIRLVIGTSDPSAPIVVDHGAWAGGDNTASCLPANCAVLVKKNTLLGGRKGRGRMFIPSPTEAGVDTAGNLTSSQLSDFTSRANDFLTGLAGISGVDGVFLFHSSSVDPPTEITSLSVDPVIATQRRRMRD